MYNAKQIHTIFCSAIIVILLSEPPYEQAGSDSDELTFTEYQERGNRDGPEGHGVISRQFLVASHQRPALIPNPQTEAEEYFLKAIESTQHQQAKSWELRASTSLARPWQQQGKRKEAHKLVSTIYGWFTEGFDTADLKEAKALLKELSHRVIEPSGD